MAAMRQPRGLTFEEYLRVEREAESKSEFLDGHLYSMAGGSSTHSFIAANLMAALISRLRGSGCRVGTSDLRVATEDGSFSAYPDVSVVCGPPRYLDDHRDVLLNPLLIMEVLSPSTESYDRNAKFERYQRVESLMDYLLVSQDNARVELWHKEDSGWALFTAEGLDSEIIIPSLGIPLRLSEVYDGIVWE